MAQPQTGDKPENGTIPERKCERNPSGVSFAFNHKFFEQSFPYSMFEKLASACQQDFADTLRLCLDGTAPI